MRWRVIAVTSVIFAFALSRPAFAGDPGPTVGGTVEPSGPSVSVSNGTEVTPPPNETNNQGSGGPSCIYISTYSGEYGPPSVFDPDEDLATGQPGHYYDVYCNGVWDDKVFVPAGTAVPGGAVANPLVLAEQAEDNAPFPHLSIVMSPPSTREAVNFPIFLSLSGYSPVSASAAAGGVTSTVSVVPGTVTWNMGDGHTVTCNGPGVAYDPSRSFASQLPPPCGYTYSVSSADQPGEVFQVTATVSYSATWTVTGAPGGGTLGPVNRTASIPVTVGEIQVLNQ